MLDLVREVICLRHFSLKPEKPYMHHVQDFILFRNKRHAKNMEVDEIRAYLSHLQILASTLAHRFQQLPRRQR